MNFVFWQNMPTHHQAPWLAALACHAEVWVAHEAAIPGWRSEMGWVMPDYGKAHVSVGLTETMADSVVREAGPQAIHVFSGISAYPQIQRAFVQSSASRRKGIMSECPPREGLRGRARWAAGKVNHLRYSRQIGFVLGMGDHAGIWYRSLGYAPEKVFDFAYYPPLPESASSGTGAVKSNFWQSGTRLLFIGQLIPRKGVDLLIAALAENRAGAWSLQIVGVGAMEQTLREQVQSLGLADRVTFHGALPNDEAMAALASADMLILPSRFDGYGAVVSEALLRGIPVICSSECGARQNVVENPECGNVFRTQEQLVAQLAMAISAGRLTEQRSELIKVWARQSISPAAGARYFLNIINHLYDGAPRPTPPWAIPAESLYTEASF